MKKFLSVILLCLFVSVVWAQNGDVYDPVNPADPDVYYKLMVEASPKKGGKVYSSAKQIPAGSAGAGISCDATANAGYKFKHWMVGDKVVSTESSFWYSMPKENTVLVAYFDWVGNDGYDPQNPEDPFVEGYQHKVTLYATPSVGGSFNSGSFYLTEGEIANVYAYPNSGYRFVSWKQNGKIISTHNPMEITMDSVPLEFTAQFVYDPKSPSNPGANNFNATTGELIIDDFEAGMLSSAIFTTLASDDNYTKVKNITIIGAMQPGDFGFLNRMTNCSVVDLSRTTGYNEVPDYAFEGAVALKTLVLPYSVERIGIQAFCGCTSLSTLYVYATTPPTITKTTFDKNTSSIKVLVPAMSLELYQNAEYWKNFKMSALDGVTNTLTISLPEDAKDGRYKNMILELDNITSGQIKRMLIMNRTRYSFVNLIHNTKYNVYVKTAQSVVIGELQNIEIVDKDVTKAFAQLKQPQAVTISVVNQKGEDLTESTDITWLDEGGNYLTTGNSISGYVEGNALKYRIKLLKDAMLYYATPKDSMYVVKAGNNNFTYVLTPLQLITVKGFVKNAGNKRGIADASVSISQTTSGRQNRTVVAKTDKDGTFTAEVYNSPASITLSAFDYANKTIDISSFATVGGKATISDIMLNSVVGATINVNLTYQPSVLEGNSSVAQNWYNDYMNVALSVYNLTTRKEVPQISNRYPQFVVMDGVKIGDKLKLTLSSNKNDFEPVVIEKSIDSTEVVDATFLIKQKGGIQTSYLTTKNESVAVLLYDKNGELLKRMNFSNDKKALFEGINDGVYSLVIMGRDDNYNSISNLARFKDVGLIEKIDYVKKTINVTSGVIKNVTINDVPFLNVAKLHAIDYKKSSLAVNKPSVVAGNYLTFTGTVEFNYEYIDPTDTMALVVDIPHSASFVKGSVMVGDDVVTDYTLVNNILTIPYSNAKRINKIKFCIIPTKEGNFNTNAMVRLKANGENVLVPLGSANYTVEKLSISVPKVVSKTEFAVSGVAFQTDAEIQVYDGDVLLGKTKPDKSGRWYLSVSLGNPTNLSKHYISAKVHTKDGVEYVSETRTCEYDIDAVAKVSSVTMYYWNSFTRQMYEVKFDFLHPDHQPESYVYYSNTGFTFNIDFVENDPEIIYDVVLYVLTGNGKWTPLKASYDKEKGQWYAKGNFSKNRPLNVAVDYKTNKKSRADAEEIEGCLQLAKNTQADNKEYMNNVDSLFKALDWAYDSGSDNAIKKAQKEIEALSGVPMSYEGDVSDVDDVNEEELNSEIETILADDNSWDGIVKELGDNYKNIAEYLKGCEFKNCDGINADWLKEQGFKSMDKTNSKRFYYKTTEDYYSLVDFDNNLYLTVDLHENSGLSSMVKSFGTTKAISLFNSWDENLQELCNQIKTAINTVTGVIDHLEQSLYSKNEKLQTELDRVNKRIKVREKGGLKVSRKLLRNRDDLIKQIMKNDKIASNLESSLKNFHIGAKATKFFAIADIAFTAMDAYNDYKEITGLYNSVPHCAKKEDEKSADGLREEIRNWGIGCGAYYVANFGASLVQLGLMSSGTLAAIPTGGASLAAVGVAAGMAAANVAAAIVYQNQMENHYNKFSYRIQSFKCSDEKEPEEDKQDDEPKGELSGNSNSKYVIDPSGFVYEGVFNNRIEGVTATCYNKIQVEDMYGDLHDKVQKWDAEEYGQENPLHTDKDGFYQWFVPEGLWQVRFEKEGYETVYSEWLPVPPPQLDVNIAMLQNRQPEVKEVHAFKDGVEISFDKYMLPAYLTTSNIKVWQGGKYVEGKIVLVDEEISGNGSDAKYASTVRFVPNAEFAGNTKVSLMVNNRVKSYADIPMAETFTQDFDIEKEVKSLSVDSLIKVPYQKTKVITVSAKPSDAVAGKVMHAESSSEMLATVVQKDITIDRNGNATFEIRGDLPGTAGITFTVPGTKVVANSVVNIEQEVVQPLVSKPTASLESGASVYGGTRVELSASDKGYKIWYTTDSTCPCDENGSRKLYSAAIAINSDMTIKAITENADGEASEVATFVYSILRSTDGVSLSKGWNWISFNMEMEAQPNSNTMLASGQWTSNNIIKNQQYFDMYSSETKKWIGTLSKHECLNNTQMYKIHSSQTQHLGLIGKAANPADVKIAVDAGWNYIGYTPLVDMDVTEALKNYMAHDGDVIKSQDAFAVYTTKNGWEGDLMSLAPGHGYMLKRSLGAGKTSFCYPSGVGGASAKANTVGAKCHPYAENMNIVGEISDIDIQEGDSVIALVNGELRGFGMVDEHQKVYLTIHGDEDANVILALQRDGNIVATANETVGYQSNTVIGTPDSPTAIRFSSTTDNEDFIGTVRSIYSATGIKMKTTEKEKLPVGIYVIYSESNGKTSVTKYIRK